MRSDVLLNPKKTFGVDDISSCLLDFQLSNDLNFKQLRATIKSYFYGEKISWFFFKDA